MAAERVLRRHAVDEHVAAVAARTGERRAQLAVIREGAVAADAIVSGESRAAAGPDVVAVCERDRAPIEHGRGEREPRASSSRNPLRPDAVPMTGKMRCKTTVALRRAAGTCCVANPVLRTSAPDAVKVAFGSASPIASVSSRS